MFALAILVGIYSYIIFSLGILGILYKETVFFSTFVFIILSLLFYKKNKYEIPRINLKKNNLSPFLIIFGILAGINLIGAFGPELSFDALWYHLTIPKIFIESHQIEFIPGSLLYYSVMPKLGDMLYIPALMLNSEILAKLIQWSFGILTSFVIYIISRKYFAKKASFLAVLVFYGSLVVAWESTVAYVDLIRTFFEIMAVWGVINFFETKDRKWLIEAALMLGFAVSTKFIAIASLPIFIIIFLLFIKDKKLAIKNSLIFSGIVFFVTLPWLVFSYVNTSNPLYPILSDFYPVSVGLNLLNPIYFVESFFNLFFRADDPISPIYIMILPLILIYFKKIKPALKFIAIYSILALIIWYITPRTGGGRFILPYLPTLSILSVAVIEKIENIKIRKYIYFLIILVCSITIFYRGIANSRYIPVILGQELKSEFLTKNLNFSYGDFYDTDGYFATNISKDDMVLLFGFHNLYYINFPFIDSSYVKKGDKFNYIATQNTVLPKRFSQWNLVYSNPVTKVNLYQRGGIKWSY